jgi:hypothetical protein
MTRAPATNANEEDDRMKRSRTLLLVLMVALLALASLPHANAVMDCSGLCANQENLCTRGCGLNGNCLNNCFTNYQLCLGRC